MGLIDEAMSMFYGKPKDSKTKEAEKMAREEKEKERQQRAKDMREGLEMMKSDAKSHAERYKAELRKPSKDRDMSIINGQAKGKDEAWE